MSEDKIKLLNSLGYDDESLMHPETVADRELLIEASDYVKVTLGIMYDRQHTILEFCTKGHDYEYELCEKVLKFSRDISEVLENPYYQMLVEKYSDEENKMKDHKVELLKILYCNRENTVVPETASDKDLFMEATSFVELLSQWVSKLQLKILKSHNEDCTYKYDLCKTVVNNTRECLSILENQYYQMLCEKYSDKGK